MLARLGRPSPAWIVISAAWSAATLALAGLGLYYLATGARTLGQSLVVLLAGVGGFTAYLYLRHLFTKAAAADRAAGRHDAEAGEVDETRFEIVDARVQLGAAVLHRARTRVRPCAGRRVDPRDRLRSASQRPMSHRLRDRQTLPSSARLS